LKKYGDTFLQNSWTPTDKWELLNGFSRKVCAEDAQISQGRRCLKLSREAWMLAVRVEKPTLLDLSVVKRAAVMSWWGPLNETV